MKQQRHAEPLEGPAGRPGLEPRPADGAPAQEAAALQQTLLDWYEAHGRKDLPWQIERTPYRVWISEIMLQQTQVASVIPYFQRFVERFPNVEALARAPLDEVLEHWAGLGYYARARNLHRAASIVSGQFGGSIPDDLAALTALPGVGRSTAGAIRSLGHGRPAPILDGNVKRVLSRYFGLEGWPGASAVNRQLWTLSERLTPSAAARLHNQALMDLGATVCKPRDPECRQCPWTWGCQARLTDRTAALPSPKPRRELPTRHRLALMLVDDQERVYLERRPPTGIWGGLWCLPLIDRHGELDAWAEGRGITLAAIEALPRRRHTFSHFHLDYDPLRIRARVSISSIGEPEPQIWLPRGRPCALGLPTPMKKLLTDLGYLD